MDALAKVILSTLPDTDEDSATRHHGTFFRKYLDDASIRLPRSRSGSRRERGGLFGMLECLARSLVRILKTSRAVT